MLSWFSLFTTPQVNSPSLPATIKALPVGARSEAGGLVDGRCRCKRDYYISPSCPQCSPKYSKYWGTAKRFLLVYDGKLLSQPPPGRY